MFKDGCWFPRVDISENDKKIRVRAELSEVEIKDIDVLLDGRLLTIKSKKKYEKEGKEKIYNRVKRSYGYFNRTIELPSEVDAFNVDASFKKGVLYIQFKKTNALYR